MGGMYMREFYDGTKMRRRQWDDARHSATKIFFQFLWGGVLLVYEILKEVRERKRKRAV